MCSTYDKCDYCRIGFTKNSNGQCILDSNKLNFNVSLYNYKKKLLIEYSNNIKNNDISKNKEILEKLNDNNCTTFNDGESICKACKYPYDVKNNKCVYICKNEHCLDCTFYYDDNNFSYKENCTKCKDYYNLINGTCFFNGTCYDKNCEKCSSEGKTDCLKCKEDKGLSGGLCYETNCYDKNCELCHNKEEDSSCVRCKEGKQLHGGFCKDPSFISNDNYNNNNKESDNINNIDESCKKHISNCKICLNKSKCSKCEDNYKLSDQKLICSKEKSKLNSWIIAVVCIVLLCIGIPGFICCLKSRNQRRNGQVINNVNVNQKNINRNTNNNNYNNDINKKIMYVETWRQNLNKNNLEDEFGKFPQIGECRICMKSGKVLGNFKCGCALQVCKECYVACKSKSNICPGCRKNI